MKFLKFLGFALTAAAALSCSVTELSGVFPDNNSSVSVTFADPVAGSIQSKALDGSFAFSFEEENDYMTVCPANSGTYMNYALIRDPNNPKVVALDLRYFSMIDGIYYAIYPKAFASDAQKIPMNFTGQVQNGNDSPEHLAEFDMNCARAKVTNNKGSFNFIHKVAWLKVTVPVTQATVFSSVTVSADEGVAQSAFLNAVTGEVVVSRQADDEVALSFGTAGALVEDGGSLVAYVTVPAGTYTNLRITSSSDKGEYFELFPGQVALENGKYYRISIQESENAAFTSLTTPGWYTGVDADAPFVMLRYNAGADQMSYGSGSSYKTFKIFNPENGKHGVLKMDTTSLSMGVSFTGTEDFGNGEQQRTFTVVNVSGKMVWLEDTTDHAGCIIFTE